MKLPYLENAVVPEKKLTHYLLDLEHPDGKSKAKFFRHIGFDELNTKKLESELLKIAKSNKVLKVDESKAENVTYEPVIKYTIIGTIKAPNRKKYKIETGWVLEVGKEVPRLSTAYVYKKGKL